MIFLSLFFEFFKTGLFAVGGGLATLPFLSRMAETMGWFTQSQLADMVAVSESTPGPIGVNTATYVGFTTAGIPGAVVATIGLITPSIIIIIVISMFLKTFRSNQYVDKVFYCLRPTSVALIAVSGLSVAAGTFITESGKLPVNWKAAALAAVLLVLTRVIPKTKKLHPIVFIILSAAAGIVFSF